MKSNLNSLFSDLFGCILTPPLSEDFQLKFNGCFRFRPLSPEDLLSFTGIRSDVRYSLHDSTNYSLTEVQGWFSEGCNGNSYFAITRDSSQDLIGYIKARDFDDVLHIGLYLSAEFQEVDIVSRLWKFLLSTLADFNFATCQINVLKSDQRALKLYLSLGFELNGETEVDNILRLNLQSYRQFGMPTFVYMVMGPKDEDFVDLNIVLTQKLNSNSQISFMISIQDDTWKDFKKIPILNQGNRMLVQRGDFLIRPEEEDLFRRARASLYHARALENLFRIPISNSSRVVILDPDFYIIKRNWMESFASRLSNDKKIFGAGYNPKHITSYKNFPTPYFLMFNAGSVDPTKLNPYPNPAETEEWPGGEIQKAVISRGVRKIRRLILPLSSMLIWRTRSSNETGYQIAKHFKARQAQCLEVAIRRSDTFMPLHLRTRAGRFVESVFFGRFKFGLMPMRKNYCEQKLSKVSNPAWDEYYDHGDFAAFHVRKSYSISVYNTSIYGDVWKEVDGNLANFCR